MALPEEVHRHREPTPHRALVPHRRGRHPRRCHPRPRRTQLIPHRAQGRIHAQARRAASAAIGGAPSAARRPHSASSKTDPRPLTRSSRSSRSPACKPAPRKETVNAIPPAGSVATASPFPPASRCRTNSQRSASRKGSPAHHPLGACGATETRQSLPTARRPASREACRRVNSLEQSGCLAYAR